MSTRMSASMSAGGQLWQVQVVANRLCKAKTEHYCPPCKKVNLYKEIPYNPLPPMSDLYQRDRTIVHQARRPHNSAMRTLRIRKILSLAAVHRSLSPQVVRCAFPVLFEYDKKAKRDLDYLTHKEFLVKYVSQKKFYSDAYVITNKGYRECLKFDEVDNNIIPLSYEPPEGAQLLHDLDITESAIEL